jgi:hypothetical protein
MNVIVANKINAEPNVRTCWQKCAEVNTHRSRFRSALVLITNDSISELIKTLRKDEQAYYICAYNRLSTTFCKNNAPSESIFISPQSNQAPQSSPALISVRRRSDFHASVSPKKCPESTKYLAIVAATKPMLLAWACDSLKPQSC